MYLLFSHVTVTVEDIRSIRNVSVTLYKISHSALAYSKDGGMSVYKIAWHLSFGLVQCMDLKTSPYSKMDWPSSAQYVTLKGLLYVQKLH